MGLAIPALRYLVREHLRKPFDGPVLTLGRQCVYATLADVQDLMRADGLEPRPVVSDDVRTNIPSWRDGPYAHFTSDRAFWAALARLDVYALDISEYERPDFMWDLNSPIPEELIGRFGLIVDGGTIEHIFDIKQALMNINRMLRSGGRIIHMSPMSNYVEHGFYQFSPTVFFDYYGVNGFGGMGCTVADQGVGDSSFNEWYFREWNPLRPEAIVSPHPLLLVFRAEKQPSSTWETMPLQGDYGRVRKAQEAERDRLQQFGRLLGAVRASRPVELAVYGAGENGRLLVRELREIGAPVRCFVDSNERLWGQSIDGLEVISIDAAADRGVVAYAIGSLASASSISRRIRDAYQGRLAAPEIFSVQ
ncbi:MAG: hypothetical protein HYX75_16170 [Acidobacteria bacterium]|nr:hypothetical protein [Acidobacteriota bacterium]